MGHILEYIHVRCACNPLTPGLRIDHSGISRSAICQPDAKCAMCVTSLVVFGKYQDQQVHKKSKSPLLDSKKGYYSKRPAWLCTGNRADENTQTPQLKKSETFAQSKIPSFQQLKNSGEEARRGRASFKF